VSNFSLLKDKLKVLLLSFLVVGIFIGSILFSQSISDNETILTIVDKFGYLGVMCMAIIAGLNTFVPLPAATFASVFIAAGLTLPLIVLSLAIGTLIADFVGYVFGNVTREIIIKKYPKLFDFIQKLQEKHHKLILPLVFLYASFVPFPNEVIIIPLALSGISFKKILIPLILGNFVHQAVLIYGVTSLTAVLPWV